MDRYVGKRLDGRYEIREIIGVGGMAVVYKAYDTIESRIVAIKILKQEFVSNAEFVRRFKNESKAIAVLSHPNIVKVYDVSFGDLIQYIVMEYIDGITLKQYIESSQKIPWKNTVSIIMQILRALQHAHDKGIIHRDVKPQNIMLTHEGTIKVTDFGIARFARSDYKTITDKAIGSVHYISPEQARSEVTDEKADIYSLGVIMYEMLSGQLPFEAESAVIVAMMQLQNEAKPLREIDPTIPLGLVQITMNAMEKEIVRRYQTAAEMLCDLEAFRRDPAATFERNYYVDNAPTRFIPQSEIVKEEEEKEEIKKVQNKNVWIPIVTGVLISLAVVILFFLGKEIYQNFTTSSGPSKCPQFVGMTLEEINKKYGDDEYSFKIVKVEKDPSEYKNGEVVTQKPAKGTEVKKKDKITLHVAVFEDMIEVPHVEDIEKDEAVAQLQERGFKNIVFEKINDDAIVEGNVVKLEPAAESLIYPNTELKVFISEGKKIIYTEVPGLLDISEEDVEEQLKDAKLELGYVSYEYSETQKGYVIYQSEKEGNTVKQGTKINITVSKGQKPVVSIYVTVTLPPDCAFDAGYVTLEGLSETYASGFISSYTNEGFVGFEIKSTKDTETFDVYLMDASGNRYKYQQMKADFKKDDFKVTKEYKDYPIFE